LRLTLNKWQGVANLFLECVSMGQGVQAMRSTIRQDDAAVLAAVVRSLAGDVHRLVGSSAEQPRELAAVTARIRYLAGELRRHQPGSPLLRWLLSLEREVEAAMQRYARSISQAACA
jgi:hypothetical protein